MKSWFYFKLAKARTDKDRQTDRHSRQTQAGCQADRGKQKLREVDAERQAGRQAGRDRQTDRQKQAGRQTETGRQTDKQRQAGRQRPETDLCTPGREGLNKYKLRQSWGGGGWGVGGELTQMQESYHVCKCGPSKLLQNGFNATPDQLISGISVFSSGIVKDVSCTTPAVNLV